MEKILKLIKSNNNDDHLLALNLLVHNYNKEQIIKFFDKNRDGIINSSDVLSRYQITINREQRGWKYYYYKDMGFFLDATRLQLYKHSNAYSEYWDPEEL